MKPEERFLNQPIEFAAVAGSRVAYRRFGRGPALLLVHGWPFNSFSYHQLLPALAQHFTCIALDLPGCGDTEWSEETDFSFVPGQVGMLRELVSALGFESYDVLGHDTGATIARHLAVRDRRLRRLAILNTEIPGHRPPWVPLYRVLMALPASALVFRQLLRSRAFLRSGAGFGGTFADPRILEGPFYAHTIAPLLESPRRIEGIRRYIRGLDWALVDELSEIHGRLEIPVIFVWGAQDQTFPVKQAREMVSQIPGCRGFHEVQGARLLPQMERPDEVARHVVGFLRS